VALGCARTAPALPGYPCSVRSAVTELLDIKQPLLAFSHSERAVLQRRRRGVSPGWVPPIRAEELERKLGWPSNSASSPTHRDLGSMYRSEEFIRFDRITQPSLKEASKRWARTRLLSDTSPRRSAPTWSAWGVSASGRRARARGERACRGA
jgi:hypothetical protein